MACLERGMIRQLAARWPKATQIMISAGIAASSDATVQIITEPRFDASRTFRFFSIYVFFAGPLNLGWLLALNRFRIRPVPAVFADQFVFYPFLLTAIVSLAAYGKALQSDAWHLTSQAELPVLSELISNVVASLPELMPKAWCWWIPAQLIIFSYVPILYRLTAVMCASYCWNLFLSFEINSEKKDKTA